MLHGIFIVLAFGSVHAIFGKLGLSEYLAHWLRRPSEASRSRPWSFSEAFSKETLADTIRLLALIVPTRRLASIPSVFD